jgi:mRNA interferase HigB
MNVISKKKIIKYGKKQSSSRKPLEAWYTIMSTKSFSTIQDLRNTFNSVDPVGDFTIFNIGGNNFRLIAKVSYEKQICMIKEIMTHAQYDKWSAT